MANNQPDEYPWQWPVRVRPNGLYGHQRSIPTAQRHVDLLDE